MAIDHVPESCDTGVATQSDIVLFLHWCGVMGEC